MTVAEIKEYIDKEIDWYIECQKERPDETPNRLYMRINQSLRHTKQLLNELEPNKQIMWERDMAIKQLEDLGYKFCGKERNND